MTVFYVEVRKNREAHNLWRRLVFALYATLLSNSLSIDSFFGQPLIGLSSPRLPLVRMLNPVNHNRYGPTGDVESVVLDPRSYPALSLIGPWSGRGASMDNGCHAVCT